MCECLKKKFIVAYITNNLNKFCENKININDYLKNNELQENIKQKKKFLICSKNNELRVYKTINGNYFIHKTKMSDWHKNWQSHFKITEKTIGKHRADAISHDMIIEFQHSRIKIADVESRLQNCINNNKKLIWVIDCNNSINVNPIGEKYLIYFSNPEDYWKYEHFTSNQEIYLDCDDKIYKINPNEVKSHMIDVNEYKNKHEFIEMLKNNNNIWNDIKIEQCTLYFNQRGAGCGKTYESIQLIENTFKHKKTFIYLTRMHSAKEVIYNELMEQYEYGHLNNIELEELTNHTCNKQYKIKYHNNNTTNDCQIIIGTIDSFMWNIGDNNNKSNDYFKTIAKSIKEGYNKIEKNGKIKYAKEDILLNRECLIIVDEAQDLDIVYVEALCSIMYNTHIDTYIIGDKLQSIWGENNIHTFLENNELPHVNIEKSKSINRVMRFHNEQFKNFVNDIIDYKKYSLPSIEDICNIGCKYEHENDIKPFHILEMKPIRDGDGDDKQNTDALIKKIISCMNDEINKYNYGPKHFTFIFPVLTKNFLANRLEAKIQEFWINKFNDKIYLDKTLDTYWKNRKNKYNKYVYLHKSDDGKAINLKESENSTRIMSIHASKGTGCEVVFLLNITENLLNMFSKETGNLVYDSLLHVAITRQKKMLYLGIENNNDDIYNRFTKFSETLTFKPDIKKIKTFVKLDDIITTTINNDIFFNKIFDTYISEKNIDELIEEREKDKNIIDWGHHIIRNSVFNYNFILQIANDKNIQNFAQIMAIMKKISNCKIETYSHEEYYQVLNTICKNNKERVPEKNNTIPILCFNCNKQLKYNKYTIILRSIMVNIQKKIIISLKNNQIPLLCPMETIIILHMINIIENGKYVDITIMDIYSIMYCYDESSNSLNNNHKSCLCKEKFTEGNNSEIFDTYNDIRNSIKNHYEEVNFIENMYINYKNYITTNYKDQSFKHNIKHKIYLKNNKKAETNFRICNTHEIIAYSEFYVINIIMVPHFNKLNKYEIIFKSIFNNYIINNCGNDKEKNIDFLNKKIITCILTLDTPNPIFMEFDISKENELLKQCIKDYLFNTYSKLHILLYRCYKYYQKEKINKPLNKIINEIKKLETIPFYIRNYYKNINNSTIKHITDEKIFLSNINETLINAIDEYLDEELDLDEEEIEFDEEDEDEKNKKTNISI